MIAVYDDDQSTIDVIKIILEAYGFTDVYTTTVESEIINILESGRVELIITDMTGHSIVLGCIRALGITNITMSADRNNKPNLPKPFEMDELIKLVKERLCSA